MYCSCMVCTENHDKIEDYTKLLMRKTECDFFKCIRVTKKTFLSLVHQLENTHRFRPVHYRAGQPATCAQWSSAKNKGGYTLQAV